MFTPPVAVRVVVVVVAAMVEVTTDDCEVVKSALLVGTKVARYGWSAACTRSDSVTEAVPDATAWVPTRTAPSRNSTLPAGVPAGAVTVGGQGGGPAGDDGAERGRGDGRRRGRGAGPAQAERADAGGEGAVAVDRDGVRRARGRGERHGGEVRGAAGLVVARDSG